jgi:hypothetical protein
MNEKKIDSDEEARIFLTLKDSRLRAIEKIRSRGYARYAGLILSAAIMLTPLLLHWNQKIIALAILMGVLVGLGWEQRRTERRFDALVEFLEKEGVIRK